jgi:hypothetical protein
MLHESARPPIGVALEITPAERDIVVHDRRLIEAISLRMPAGDVSHRDQHCGSRLLLLERSDFTSPQRGEVFRAPSLR